MRLKWLMIVLGLGFAAVLAGTSAFDRASGPTPPAALPTTGSAAPATTVAPSPTRVVPSQSSPTSPSRVTAATAEQIVRAYFAALAAKDVATARQLTAGQAREATDYLIDRIQTEERTRGVTVVIQTRRLDLSSPVATGGQWQVGANFSVDVGAQVGPVVVPAQTIVGQAMFTVDQVDGQPRIVRITGLQL